MSSSRREAVLADAAGVGDRRQPADGVAQRQQGRDDDDFAHGHDQDPSSELEGVTDYTH